MDSQTWRQIGRGALAGAVAGAALAAMGLRIGLNGALQPAPARTSRRSSSLLEPPFDAPEPSGHREEARAVVTQAVAGAALGGLYGLVRARVDRAESPVESDLYGMVLSTLGLGAWLAPLGLLADEEARPDDGHPADWSFHRESLLDDDQPPYQAQPPYDPDTPYDVF
jgi:hypothetical protein